MKLNSQENEVLTNSTKESKFTINASAQAFKILSDGLYEHKIAAIVRELSCNAHDAHVEAGNQDVPFKVVLPNNLHPYFEIEDFGVGLDDDGVREVYTSYFTSTKNDSNDAIGAFGLGSKTPFSYTNNFTIRARKDGAERVYSAYIGSDGAPCVNMMYEKATDENNGVKITVPVKEWDFNQFKFEASFVLSFFKTQPIVTDPTFEISAPGVIEELDELGIVTKKIDHSGSSLYTGHVYAVMGGVCYRLDEHWIRHTLNDIYLNQIVLGNMWGSNRATLFIKFNIGELEVAASRETLSLDEDTRNVVLDKIRDGIEVLKKDDQEKVDAQGHMIKAVKYIYDLYNLGQMSCGMFSYNGKKLNRIVNRTLFPSDCADVEMFDDRRVYRWNKKKVKRQDHITVDYIASANIINAVYYEDGQKKSGIVKHGRQKTPDKGEGICLVFNGPLSERQRERVEKYLGRDDIEWFNLQDLKDEEKANNPTTPSASGSTPVSLDDSTIRAVSVEFDGAASGNRMSSSRINLKDGKEYYWSYSDSDHFYTGTSYIPHRLFYQCLKLLGKDPGDVVVVHRNLQNQKKIIKNEIPCFTDVIKDALQDNTAVIEVSFISRKLDLGINRIIRFIRESEPEDLKGSINELDDMVDPDMFEGEGIDLRMVMSLQFYKEFDIDIQEIENRADEYVNKTNGLKDDLLEKYPMLSFASHYDFVYDQSKLIDYVKLVDSQSD